MKRTTTRLADGRELIYFDERDDVVRDAVDRRHLSPPPDPSELRYDPLTGEWVAVAAHRQARTHLPPSDECPLCPSTADRTTEIPAHDYDVVVFENRFPSLSQRPGPAARTPPTRYSPTRPGLGRCEVVCFTAEHSASFASLPPARVRTVLHALADRTAELSALAGIEQVFCFENRGVEIGVTLHHPHGQIYAFPFITPRTERYLHAAREHVAGAGGNLYTDVLAAERAAAVRVVASNDHWTAYVPAAARWPFEVHLAPHRRPVPDLPSLTEPELDAFGPLYLDVLGRLDGLFGVPMPYVAAWHQAPVREGRDVSHLHLQLFSTRRARGKLKYLAGVESAMGAFVNDVRPEDAAARLRAATPRP